MAGFQLSLDDYGTGGSNFELLRLCPFTELKIDGSIIRSAATEAIAYRFLESAVAMAGELDIEVVAEGVETEAQLELARQVGVRSIQGFLLSMPCPADETTGLIAHLSTLKG
jgi:EAL domain-containing protein (putative c-di-GMP-specific phosphodiesterase class I)